MDGKGPSGCERVKVRRKRRLQRARSSAIMRIVAKKSHVLIPHGEHLKSGRS